MSKRKVYGYTVVMHLKRGDTVAADFNRHDARIPEHNGVLYNSGASGHKRGTLAFFETLKDAKVAVKNSTKHWKHVGHTSTIIPLKEPK